MGKWNILSVCSLYFDDGINKVKMWFHNFAIYEILVPVDNKLDQSISTSLSWSQLSINKNNYNNNRLVTSLGNTTSAI